LVTKFSDSTPESVPSSASTNRCWSPRGIISAKLRPFSERELARFLQASASDSKSRSRST